MTGTADGSGEEPSIVVTQYETLRGAALGEVLPPEARSGLTLLLHRGMWRWAKEMATTGASQQPTRSPSSDSMTQTEYKPVIHVFAAMAIQADHWGAPP